jgi:hypothetical protein
MNAALGLRADFFAIAECGSRVPSLECNVYLGGEITRFQR